MALSDDELAYFKNRFSKSNNLTMAVSNAVASDPDRAAEDIRLARGQSLPVDTVERNREAVANKEKLQLLDVESMRETHPRTSEYMSNRFNASVSIDDVDTLKNIEHLLRQPTRGFINNAARGGLERVNTLTGNLVELAGNVINSGVNTFDEATEGMGIPNPGIVIGNDGMSWSWDIPKETPNVLQEIGGGISHGGAYDYKPQFTWEKFKGEPTPTSLAGFVVEQGIQSLPDMIASIYTLPAYIASRTEEIAEARVANNESGEVTGTDIAQSVVPAVAVAVIERLGAKVTFGTGGVSKLSQVPGRAGAAAVTEGATEFIQEGIEYLGETAGTKKELSGAEALDRMLSGMVAGAGMGGGIRATSATVEALGKKTQRQTERRALSIAEQSTIDDMITYAQESRTIGRAQESFDLFIDSLEAEQEIFIPQEAFEGIESLPEAISAKLDPLGVDVAIPVRDFMVSVAPNEELMASLRPHVRMSPSTLTQSEMVAPDVEAKTLIKKAQDAKAIESETDKIYAQVADQIHETGRLNSKESAYSAMVYPAYAKTKAEELGITPTEVFERMGLDIRGPQVSSSSAPNADVLEQSQILTPQQDFTNVVFEDMMKVAETGDTAVIKQDAQKIWDRTQKRRDVVKKLAGCLQ